MISVPALLIHIFRHEGTVASASGGMHSEDRLKENSAEGRKFSCPYSTKEDNPEKKFTGVAEIMLS
jgi:hypothetical protein